MRDFLAYGFTVVLGGILLWIFGMIWLHGDLCVKEDWIAWRAFETFLAFVVLGIGIERIISWFRRT